jgi:hypothetical protein
VHCSWQFCAQVSGESGALVLGGIICSVLFLFFCLVHLASLGYRLQPEFSSRSRSRCSEGGFGLWLGDEGIVVVKRAHNPLYSNIALICSTLVGNNRLISYLVYGSLIFLKRSISLLSGCLGKHLEGL